MSLSTTSNSVGAPADASLLRDLVGLPVAGDHGVQTVAEGLAEEAGDGIRLDLAGEEALPAAPERDEPAGLYGDLAPADARLALRRAAVPRGEQSAEVRVALPVLREEGDRRAVVQRDLGAHDEGDAKLLGPDVGADDAGDPVPVREGERTDPVLVAGLDQLFRVRRPFQEREVAFAPERDVGI